MAGDAPTGGPATAEPSAAHAAQLIDAAVAMATEGRTLLRPDDVRDALEGRAGDAELAAVFDDALGRIEAAGPEEGPIAQQTLAAGDLVATLERRFILDRKRSTLDLLGERRARRYRAFSWDPADFPDGAPGAHEARATEMFRAMAEIRPERRPNSTEHAAVGAHEVDRAKEKTIRAQLVQVEGQGLHRLHRAAAASFVEMHRAAAADGVSLRILDADRRFEASRVRSKKAGNKKAIADFSSHNLGLAVDLRMSTRRQRFRETRTSPFQNVVDMTAAPAHKWMLLQGASFGWYPYLHEPWHWEYNPSGFRAEFRASIGLPEEGEASDAGEPEPAPDGAEDAGAEEAEREAAGSAPG